MTHTYVCIVKEIRGRDIKRFVYYFDKPNSKMTVFQSCKEDVFAMGLGKDYVLTKIWEVIIGGKK